MVRCIHITPELPPTVGGIADYTAILSRQLETVSDGTVDSAYVHAGREDTSDIDVNFPVKDLSGQRSAEALSDTVMQLASEVDRRAFVLLEYAGYGYSWRGAPLWLFRGLREAHGVCSFPLVTIFHELYATSFQPWEKAFWTMPLQYVVARGLARLSSGILANRRNIARQLSKWVEDSPVRLSPTFSNVGEPDSLPEYDDRGSYAVHFGGAGQKTEVYEKYGGSLDQALRHAGIDRIVDIGPPEDVDPHRHLETPIEKTGILPANQISTLLQGASLGILKRSLHCITKSGVWAAYAAHGVPPLIVEQQDSPQTVLEENRHFLMLPNGEKGSLPLSYVSKEVKKWYNSEAKSQNTTRKVLKIIKSTNGM